MRDRYLSPLVQNFCFPTHKMAFISGPRQCGKTTFAKSLLKSRGTGQYFIWDDIEFRRLWAKDPKNVIPAKSRKVPIVVLDEIHKAKLWKRSLKGVYDVVNKPIDFIVTGSARLNVYKKGSDSLLGRYFPFRLHPFTLREMENRKPLSPDAFLQEIFSKSHQSPKRKKDDFKALFTFGGFPEPLFSQNTKMAKAWRLTRTEQVIREDLRDLSRIPELSQIEMMTSLLPERVGSLLSLASLREDLEVSFQTVKRWLEYLKQLYYAFEIKPFTKSISRSLKKDGKLYLWDYGEISNPAARFENLVACHLLKTCHYWTDSGEGKFDLFYLRDKEKHEIDFLITKDRQPWLPVEVKLNMTEPSPHWKKFLSQLPCKNGIQIVSPPNKWKFVSIDTIGKVLVGSADSLLSYFA